MTHENSLKRYRFLVDSPEWTTPISGSASRLWSCYCELAYQISMRQLHLLISLYYEQYTYYVIKSVYFALVRSILLYGIVSWESACPSTIEPLNSTHKLLERIAFKDHGGMNTSQLFDIFRHISFETTFQLFLNNTTTYWHIYVKLRYCIQPCESCFDYSLICLF